MQRFNKAINKWEPYQPAARTYPVITPTLKQQLGEIGASSDGMMKYWPACATLRDGSNCDRIFFAEASEYIKIWGVWPGDDPGKSEILIGDVISISQSPSRLPKQLADKLYRAGESGMGYVAFEIIYSDGSKSAHISGNALDFVELPNGKAMSDVSDVIPHAGRTSQSHIHSPKYQWCLFSAENDKPSLIRRLFHT